MARPYRSRTERRAPVVIAPQARPRLDVVAPLNVRTPGAATDKLQGLVQALGIAGGAMAGAKKERDEYDFNQGVADEQLGAADVERAQKSRAYAHGAYQTAILEQYQNAQAKVTQRASTELDRTLPIDQQVDIVDGWMKSELGPMVADPRAKTIFAERYQTFINTAAANIQKEQLAANAKAAEDTWKADLGERIANGTLNNDAWNEIFHNWVSQSGDPVATRNAMVSTVADMMVATASEGGDYEAIRAMIPTEVIGTDGSVLPGPMHSPEVRGAINQAMSQAKSAFDRFQSNAYAQTELSARLSLKKMLDNNVPITDDTRSALGIAVGNDPSDTFTPGQWVAYMDESDRLRAKAAAAQATYDSYTAAWKTNGRLADTLNAPGGPETKEKLDDYADSQFQRLLMASGVEPEGMSGEALVTNQGAMQTTLEFSSEQGVAYRPLENTMKSVNPASPGDVMARLGAYQQMKALNVTDLYVDDNSALIYEVALGAQKAGMPSEAIADRIRRMGDKDTASYVAANSKDIRDVFTKGFTISTPSFLGMDKDINTSQTENPAYLAGLARSLTMTGLAAEMKPSEAMAFAKERIQATHTALSVGDAWYVLPNSAVPNAQRATTALDWYTSQLPAFAKKHGIPEDEEVVIKPVMGSGRRLTFGVFRAGGVSLVPDSEFTLPGLQLTYDRLHPTDNGQGHAAERQRVMRQKSVDANRGAQFVPGKL